MYQIYLKKSFIIKVGYFYFYLFHIHKPDTDEKKNYMVYLIILVLWHVIYGVPKRRNGVY